MQRGSLTLETALALPFLLCAVAALLFVFVYTARAAGDYRSLSQKAQALAVAAGQWRQEDPYIRLYDYDTAEPPFSGMGFVGRASVQRVTVRCWVGYTGERFSGGEESFVYVTPEGEVYHRSMDCTHLRLSVRSVPLGEIGRERNWSGSRYAACEYCVKDGEAEKSVYITNYGTSYHNREGCRGLKRTVMAIPYAEVKGRPPCSRCGSP
ncbi:MAG: hypothetical protein Q4C82_09170 [Eubacteriales bacterium]|nr:hypothetical protein [Eubacteriales bacterium]